MAEEANVRQSSHAREWTTEDSKQLATLHNNGESLHAIAKQMGRSKSTVSAWSARLGLSFDRTQVAKAADAVHVDNKAKRLALESRLLDEASKVIDQMWEPATVFSFGGAANTFADHILDKPTFGDQRAIIQTASAALSAANKLADMTAETQDLPAVDAWLEAMTGANDDNQRPVGEVEAGS